MKAYFKITVKFEKNNQAKFLLMAKFVYNNIKNASTSNIVFEQNNGYYSYVLQEKRPILALNQKKQTH